MGIISDRINSLGESETLAMSQKSRELQAKGYNVINLSVGEPDFDTPQIIKKSGIKAINGNYSHYTPVAGYSELKEAICNKLKRDNNLDFKPSQIVVSAGAKHSIANVILSLINPGDEVIVPSPYWVSYRELIKFAGGVPIYLPTSIKSDFKFTAKQLIKSITLKTKMFIFSSPCNPSGTTYNYEELKEIADFLKCFPKVYIVSDEIYEHINYMGKHESIAQFDSISDRVIVVNGVSKGFAMTGWRIGYIAAPQVIASACEKLQGQFTSGACSIAQRASIEALNTSPEDIPEIKKMVKAFRKRRDLAIKILKFIPGVKTNKPDGAFYIFPDISTFYNKRFGKTEIGNCEDLSMYLLNEAHVATVPGSAFGDPNCIRISYATSIDKLEEALIRIKDALLKLK